MNDIASWLRAQIPSSIDPARLERLAREAERQAVLRGGIATMVRERSPSKPFVSSDSGTKASVVSLGRPQGRSDDRASTPNRSSIVCLPTLGSSNSTLCAIVHSLSVLPFSTGASAWSGVMRSIRSRFDHSAFCRPWSAVFVQSGASSKNLWIKTARGTVRSALPFDRA